jgi:hypothetical protein
MARKRELDEFPALRALGMEPTPVYVAVARRIAEMDLCPEGTGGSMPMKRPEGAGGTGLGERSRGAASGQQRRSEMGWLPPGFEKTRAECQDKLKFFELAKSLDHPLASFDVDLEEDVLAAVDKITALGKDICVWRELRLKELGEMADSLRPMSAELMLKAPEHVKWAAGPDAHPAFMAAVVDGLEWGDTQMPLRYCITGCSVIGQGPRLAIPGFRQASSRELEAQAARRVQVPDLLRTNAQWVKSLWGQTVASYAKARRENDVSRIAAAQAVWDKTMLECNVKDTARGPFTVTQCNKMLGFGRWRPMARFGAWQGTGADAKCRPCDNARRSGHNAAYVVPERVVLTKPTFSAMVARAFVRSMMVQGDTQKYELGGAHDDEADAYRGVPASQPEFTVVMLVDPASGEAACFFPRGHNCWY